MLRNGNADEKVNSLGVIKIQAADAPVPIEAYATTTTAIGINLHSLVPHERQIPGDGALADAVLTGEVFDRAVGVLFQFNCEQFYPAQSD